MPLSFNGTSTWVDLIHGGSYTALTSVPAITLMCWCYPTSLASANQCAIYVSCNGNSNSRAKIDILNTTFTAAGRSQDSDGLQTAVAGTTFVVNNWYFLVTVLDYTNKVVIAYVNGVNDGSLSSASFGLNTSAATNPSYAAIGSTGAASQYWSGLIHDVRAYNRVVSPAEIQTIYSALGKDKIVYGLVSRYQMSELGPGSSATAAASIIDAGSYNDDGTPNSSPTYSAGILRIA